MTDVIPTAPALAPAADPAPPAAPPAPVSLQDALYPPAAEPAPVTEPSAEPAPQPDPDAPVEPPPAVDPEAVPATAADYTFSTPEGFTVDDTAMGKFRDLAHKQGFSQTQFTEAMELHTALMTKQVEALQGAQLQTFQDTQTKWLKEVNELPEFQGERRERSEKMVGKLLDEFGTAEVRDIFAMTGAGNSPAMVKMFLKLANALGEGSPTPQGIPRPATKTVTKLEDVFYAKKES